MIITISGTAGAGKGTLGRLLAEKLNHKFYSMGDIRRKYAQDKGMTILELNKLAEKDPSSDKLVDEYLVELGKNEYNLIIDGRLAFFFVPKSFKIFLDADEKTRAERIMNDKKRNEKYSSVDETKKRLKERHESDQKRYSKLYNVNPYDVSANNYDLLLDTSKNTPEELVQMISKTLPKPL